MRPTIRDVAARAGVSTNTVSRVLNDRPDVKQSTAERVRAAIAELNYRPNSLARSLIRRSSNTIGLVVTDCTNPNTALQVRILQQTMGDAGYSVLIFDSQENTALERTALDVLEEKVVDGIILTPTDASGEALESVASRVPTVLLNRELPTAIASDVVLNDNAGGVRAAVEHLIFLGHRHIAYVTSRRQLSTVHDRLRGYRQALKTAGLPIDEHFVVRADIGIHSASEAASQLLDLPDRPTAILAYNDLMAVGVLSSLSSKGYAVPDDISLVGFDDIQYAPFLSVPLTTVQQPTEEMAKSAANILISRLRGEVFPPRREVHSSRLVVRRSTRRLT